MEIKRSLQLHPGDEARGEIDLSSPIEGIKQSGTYLVRIARTPSMWPSRSAVPIRFNIWWGKVVKLAGIKAE